MTSTKNSRDKKDKRMFSASSNKDTKNQDDQGRMLRAKKEEMLPASSKKDQKVKIEKKRMLAASKSIRQQTGKSGWERGSRYDIVGLLKQGQRNFRRSR